MLVTKALLARVCALSSCMATLLFSAYDTPMYKPCIARILSPLRVPHASPT